MSYRAHHLKDLKQEIIKEYNENILKNSLNSKNREMSMSKFKESIYSEFNLNIKGAIESRDVIKHISILQEKDKYDQIIHKIDKLVEINELNFPEDSSLEYIIDIIQGQLPK